ncbi:MAG: type I restriction enzyme HsdR N-terminal domain-containing protein, partial [Bacteroidia bacterium]
SVFDQASHYNIVLGVPYLLVTNGLQMFVCKINSEAKEYAFLEELPEFGLL